MSFLSSFLAAFIPMTAYLIIIWRLDRYEREPFTKVLKHFIWGAVGAIFFGFIFSILLSSTIQIFTTEQTIISFMGAVIIAPITEEIVKAAYLFRSYRKSYFDNITDGLVYGGAIGLGFGMTENLLYFSVYDTNLTQWISVVITRSIFSAVMHAIATATVGAFLSKMKFTTNSKKYIYPFIGLALAMLFHATWNFSLTFDFTYYLGLLFMLCLIMCFFFVFNSSLKNEQLIIIEELKNEISLKNTDDFIPDSKFNLREFTKRIKSKKERKRFTNFATKLAFRKLQARKSEGIQKDKYLTDIEVLRNKLTEINKTISA